VLFVEDAESRDEDEVKEEESDAEDDVNAFSSVSGLRVRCSELEVLDVRDGLLGKVVNEVDGESSVREDDDRDVGGKEECVSSSDWPASRLSLVFFVSLRTSGAEVGSFLRGEETTSGCCERAEIVGELRALR